MLITRKKNNYMESFSQIFQISVWSFTLVICSALFFLFGRWLDSIFGTQPTFMFGLLFLAILLCIGRLYRDAWVEMKKLLKL
ncbi:MAG: AtpZ/AtpI family protein [Deltaproteobacteria bacterium]|nr:AtpZ/AtpI family protein [Deltaproteobacteria bacterium]MBN2844781.1 AtpZ/AtpI family protein [Deltaproteobacteria bacterium]